MVKEGTDSGPVWRMTPGHAGLMLLALSLLVWSTLDGWQKMLRVWDTIEAYSYGYLIPVITAFLLWQRKDVLERLEFSGSWLGLAGLAAGIAIAAIGKLTTITTLIQYGFVISLLAVALALTGRKTFRWLFAPLALLFLMLPLPGFFYNNLSAKLQLLSSSIGVEVRLVTEDGREAAPGEVGEIAARGDNVMTGYWGKPAATAEVMKDGWFYTGDLAVADEEGYISIVDRKKDMIISGGYNVYPREVEEALYKHSAVRECAVIGVPDPKWGEAVKAVVSLKAGHPATAEDLLEHCRVWLAGYKKPQSVDLLEELPKSPNGKILKRELRKPYWEGRRRSI